MCVVFYCESTCYDVNACADPGKLPIPRLRHSTSPKVGRRDQPVVPAEPIAASPPSSSVSSSPTPITGPTPRTKTSHTTIERRYRTNINSRIQGLRAAVPALRVLEHKSGNRVGNLSFKPGTRRAGIDVAPGTAEDGAEDVIDERGFIDGVKVARKGSKANVLAKATEYIRVLKRREHRLKREQEGLKTLVRSLVGGDQLVREWEAMWRDKFGGPETDEVEGEDGDADDDNDDEEEEEDGEDLAGKKRKRSKVEPKPKKAGSDALPGSSSPAVSAGQTTPPGQPEKRKRGRPRKVPLPPLPIPANLQSAFSAQQVQPMSQVSVPTLQSLMDVERAVTQDSLNAQQQLVQQQPQTQPGQYLLAAFAFFSFFNSPLSYSSSWKRSHEGHAHEHTHTGVVLGDTHVHAVAPTAIAFGWRDVVQVIHLSVSLLLLVSVVVPWLPRMTRNRIERLVPNSLRPVLGSSFISQSRSRSRSSSDASTMSSDEKDIVSVRTALLAALQPGHQLSVAQEVQVLRDALGLRTGVFGLMVSVTRQVSACMSMCSRSRFGLERRMLEQRAVMRLAELVALDSKSSVRITMTKLIDCSFFISLSIGNNTPTDLPLCTPLPCSFLCVRCRHRHTCTCDPTRLGSEGPIAMGTCGRTRFQGY